MLQVIFLNLFQLNTLLAICIYSTDKQIMRDKWENICKFIFLLKWKGELYWLPENNKA